MGPLSGIRIIELAHIGPIPHAGMLFADMGADVLRIERGDPTDQGLHRPVEHDVHLRGKRAVRLDLKQASHVEILLQLAEHADALIEGFRPGVAERLGIGPEVVRERNSRLVYGRVTGWGREGALAERAGHDLNYLALSGALDAIGRAGAPPTPPLNLLADYGGGSMFLAWGVLCALYEAARSGVGQVVDASMIDGVASLLTNLQAARQAGLMNGPRGGNLLDSGAFFYDVYECADGRFLSVACIEERFFQELLRKLGIERSLFGDRDDPACWQKSRELLAATIRTRDLESWCEMFDGSDACVAPVLRMEEAPNHPHHRARGTFIQLGGVVQSAPSPRFSRTSPETPEMPKRATPQGTLEALHDWLPAEQASCAVEICLAAPPR